jgi:hypothetical protein
MTSFLRNIARILGAGGFKINFVIDAQ